MNIFGGRTMRNGTQTANRRDANHCSIISAIQDELRPNWIASDVKNRGEKDGQAERTEECSCDADPGPAKVRPCPRANGRTDRSSKEVTNHVHRVDSVPKLG